MLRITSSITIEESEISLSFVRSSGPGGQNVNKVATAVQLRFDVKNSPSLPEEIKRRLLRLGGKRITDEGVLVITAKRFRTQEKNRADSLSRLRDLVRKAAVPPKARMKTRVPKSSKVKRLKNKKNRGHIKKLRQRHIGSDD